MSHFAIAGLQLRLPEQDNLPLITSKIKETKRRFPWVDMIVLSELATFGTDKAHAEPLPSKTEQFYCQLAKDLNVWLIPGSHYEQLDEQIYNTASVINNQGEVIERYRKIYPFYPYESDVAAGSECIVFDVPGGRIGVAICYDLWFGEVARSMACQGAEVLIYPTLTGTIDRPVELAMAQATAASNQAYVFSINAASDTGNGQSIVVGPDGGVVYQATADSEIIPIEIDFNQVRHNRERGLHGLGQVLKSFRDNAVEFPIYQDKAIKNKELNKFGALEVPAKKTK
ncbi:carbon-nitrogen hydrolase family protein [Thalassotalea sp. Y01]|uniref:carbon-nitrogen hydrolase family protein n=1 Tax=Thalassotalea sp. Y01 TaxID=2729613 RepID=UPI00145EAF21|nr:carbon-nitrogen hydrolase family protein [Thalassotalea sp. Y01]NMP16948.1 carbon-nitrogen hydrolase family protein [Thalassotalea sp. Y01]